MIQSKTLAVLLLIAGSLLCQPAFAVNTDEHPRLQRFDRNDDGRLGPVERHNARYLHNRIDVDDNGRIGPRERAYARELRQRADFNDDGRLGPRERHTTRHILNRVDRRH